MRAFAIATALGVCVLMWHAPSKRWAGEMRPAWVQVPESLEEETPEWLDDSRMDEGEGGRGKRHRDDEGQMSADMTRNRFGLEGPEGNLDPPMAREEAREMAASAGIIGLLRAPARPGRHDAALGNDPMSATGALMGDQVGENFGFGGLGLRGTGRGRGAGGGNGLGTIGTIGHGAAGASAAQVPVARTMPRAPAPLGVTQGVVASTFVGGNGMQTRLSHMLERGVQVDGRQIKLGAFEDRARLAYPLPSDAALAMYAELERSVLHTGSERVHLQIALAAQRGERPRRPRLDIRLLLDKSGSMEGDKWRQALDATRQLIERLAPEDRLGIVAYDDDAQLVLRPQKVGDGRVALRTLDGLGADGGTNLEAALKEVERVPPQRKDASDVALVIVISDGIVTDGMSDPEQLGDSARRMFERGGVITTAIGLGTEFDEATMVALAREGAGSYHFVRDAGDVAGVLRDELDSHLQAVAQALRLRVELADGVSVARLYGSRLLDAGERAEVRQTEIATDGRLAHELGIAPDRARDDQRGVRMHIPSFRRGEQHVILLELDVPARRASGGVARVSLDYKDLLLRDNRSMARDVAAERSEDRAVAGASINTPVKRTVLAFQAGDALQRAANALDDGAASDALALLDDHRQLLSRAAQTFRDPALERDARLLGRYAQVVTGAWPELRRDDRQMLAVAMRYYGDRRMR